MITTEQKARDSFEQLIEDCGVHFSNGTVTYNLADAIEMDEIWMNEDFNNWMDSMNRDGLISDEDVAEWCLTD